MRLDIGCGHRPTRDVNCDLFIHETYHRRGNEMQPKSIPNLVRCDANYLPFRNKTFSCTYCSHVLEHKGVNPSKAVEEMIRVTNGVIELVVPHRFSRDSWLSYRQYHVHARYFNVKTLETWLRKPGLNPALQISLYKCFPHPFLCLIRLPWEIRAIIPFKGG